MKNSMSDGIEPLRKKYVVYPEERAHLREGVSCTDAGFLERVFHSAAQAIVGVGHRIVVEVPGKNDIRGTILDVCDDLLDLSRTDQDGFLDPLLGILDLVPVFPAVPQQAGQGNVVALEVAVVDPEDPLADPDVAVDGLVGALLEIQFPLAGDWVAAQGDVPPGPLVGDEHVVG